jgi:hypothetical protein
MVSPGNPNAGENESTVGGFCVTVKLLGLVPVPAELATVTRPVVAPLGTVAVILVADWTVKLALTPPNLTDETAVKLVPLISTSAPTGPVIGSRAVIEGTLVTTKSVVLVPVPIVVVTLILPVDALAGTTAVIWFGELTLNAAFTLPNLTMVVLVKPLPVKVTTVPAGPSAGLNDVMTGAPWVTPKLVAEVPVPEGELTEIWPEVAPLGTTAVILVEELIVKVAATPLKRTDVTSPRFVPLMVTLVPGAPLVGVNDVMDGGLAVTTKLEDVTAVPPPVVTAMAPVPAPGGTVAVI